VRACGSSAQARICSTVSGGRLLAMGSRPPWLLSTGAQSNPGGDPVHGNFGQVRRRPGGAPRRPGPFHNAPGPRAAPAIHLAVGRAGE
jgi:hypothetical protein